MKRNSLVCLLIFIGLSAFGSNSEREFFEAQTRYWGIHEKVTAADIDKLVELQQKIDQPGLTQEQRTKAYETLFHYVQKLRGLPEGRVPAAMAATFWNQHPRQNASRVARPHHFEQVVKRGEGPIAMILIPDMGADWTVFDSFMQRNQKDYTFYAVTLPGFGTTAPPARLSKLDYGERAWWNNAEAAILNLISQKKINHPVVLGHQAGAYLAMKVALSHPNQVRGAIVLNGLLYMTHPSIPANASPEDRAKIVNSWIPVDLFPKPTREQYRNFYLQMASWLCKDKTRQQRLVDLLSSSSSSTWWNYFAELATTDFSDPIKNLKVPLLIVPSVYDSPDQFKGSEVAVQQWQSFHQSKLPITIIPMENCRAYATEDQPAKLDEAIHRWTGNQISMNK
jgi:pimeloyl-ACP methyl ester carboxylesterase